LYFFQANAESVKAPFDTADIIHWFDEDFREVRFWHREKSPEVPVRSFPGASQDAAV